MAMRESSGNLFSYPCDALVVPCTWTVKRNGDAVMGAGVAKQAAERWPYLPALLGYWIEKTGPHVFWDRPSGERYIVCVPTKYHWREPADLELIEAMVRGLTGHADDRPDWQVVVLPRLGCGDRTGRLDWETQVRPILAELLDDRFIVVHQP